MEEKKNRPLLDSAETLRGSGRPKKNRLPAVIAVCVICLLYTSKESGFWI